MFVSWARDCNIPLRSDAICSQAAPLIVVTSAMPRAMSGSFQASVALLLSDDMDKDVGNARLRQDEHLDSLLDLPPSCIMPERFYRFFVERLAREFRASFPSKVRSSLQETVAKPWMDWLALCLISLAVCRE